MMEQRCRDTIQVVFQQRICQWYKRYNLNANAGHLIYEHQDRRAPTTTTTSRPPPPPSPIPMCIQAFTSLRFGPVCIGVFYCILNHINPSLYYVSINGIKDKNRSIFFFFCTSFLSFFFHYFEKSFLPCASTSDDDVMLRTRHARHIFHFDSDRFLIGHFTFAVVSERARTNRPYSGKVFFFFVLCGFSHSPTARSMFSRVKFALLSNNEYK